MRARTWSSVVCVKPQSNIIVSLWSTRVFRWLPSERENYAVADTAKRLSSSELSRQMLEPLKMIKACSCENDLPV